MVSASQQQYFLFVYGLLCEIFWCAGYRDVVEDGGSCINAVILCHPFVYSTYKWMQTNYNQKNIQTHSKERNRKGKESKKYAENV